MLKGLVKEQRQEYVSGWGENNSMSDKQCRAGVYCQLSFTSLMYFSTKPNPNSMSLGLSPVK